MSSATGWRWSGHAMVDRDYLEAPEAGHKDRFAVPNAPDRL
jgi:hypothetical protein